MLKWFRSREAIETCDIHSLLTTNDESLSPHIKVFEEAYITACDILKIPLEPRILEGGTLKIGADMQFYRDLSTVCFSWTQPSTAEEFAVVRKDAEAQQKNKTIFYDSDFHIKYGNVRYITINHEDIGFVIDRDTYKNHRNVTNLAVVHTTTSKKHIVSFALSTFASIPHLMKKKVVVYDMRSSRAPKYIIADADCTLISDKHRKTFGTWNEAFEALSSTNKAMLEEGEFPDHNFKIYKVIIAE